MTARLTPQDSAFLLIDQQAISMTFIKTQPVEIAQQNTLALARTAVALGAPNIWTSSSEDENKDWWMPGLEEIDKQAYENRVKRTGIIDSWDDPRFVRAVEATGRRTLIMAGTTNDGCLLYTALSAKRAGYDVYVALDASGSAFDISEQAAWHRMNQAGIVLSATDTIIGELARDWATPHGKELRQILADTFQVTIGGFGLAN